MPLLALGRTRPEVILYSPAGHQRTPPWGGKEFRALCNAAVSSAASQALKGILGTTDKPNVSADFNHDSHSSIFHLDQTKVMDGNLVRVLSWYDNEWGFSNRMVDTAVAMGKLG